MLARLAGDINVLAHAGCMQWTCCEQDFYRIDYWGRDELWSWRFCNGGMPGEPFTTRPCGHWHHQHEPPLIAYASSRQ